MLVLKLNFGINNEEKTVNILPTPTVIEKETLEELPIEVINDGNPEYPLAKLLPYTTNEFSVIGYDEAFVLVAKDKSENKVENEKEIKKWIEDNIPGDNLHKILWLN